MSTFSANGRGHSILSRLDDGPATSGDLIDATRASDRKARSKAWRALVALRDAGFVEVNEGLYFATQDGRDALACLRGGQPVVVAEARPSVRVFAERRAA